MGNLSHFFIALKRKKMESKLIKKIRELILPTLEQQNIDLVAIELKGRSGVPVLRIFADTDGGISLDQCVRLSRELSDLLDAKNPIVGRYRLEVSSPGLDRPLKTERDFQRNLGRKVRVDFRTEAGETRTITGTIEQVDGNELVIMQNHQRSVIDRSSITIAKILPVW